MVFMMSFASVFGQEINQDTTSLNERLDSALLMPDTALLADADSIRQRDSVPAVVIVGLEDPLDTLSNRIFAYQVLTENSYARLQIPIDTSLSRFEINNPVMKKYYAGAFLGNVGLSYYPIGFEARKRPSDFLFTDNVALFMHLPEKTTYYQTKMPFTMIHYSSAGSRADNESILKLTHTQNVNKQWNVGLDYDAIASAGQYSNQNTSDHAISLFSAYRGSQYTLFTNFNWNNIRMRENGGLANVGNFKESIGGAETNPVRSMVGKTVMVDRSFYLMQSYSPRQGLFSRDNSADSVNVSRFTVAHTLKYEWMKREFSDTATYFPARKPNLGTKNTHDSLYFRRFENHLELMIKEQSRNNLTAGFSAGILAEMDRYNINMKPDSTGNLHTSRETNSGGWGQDVPKTEWLDTVINYRRTENYLNAAVTGRFFNHTGKYLNWDFNGRFYFLDKDKSGNFNINGTVQLHYYTPKGKNTLLLGGAIDNAKPSYFLKEYYSNWLQWKTDFKASQETRLRGEFLMPHHQFKAGVYLSLLTNHIYFNEEAVPKQYDGAISVATGFLEKDFQWWKLHFLFRLYGQFSNSGEAEIIPLPAFAGSQSTYFEGWLVRDVMNIQLGWDVAYHSKYYAYAYMPSSGMFYLQKEQEVGGYPFVDAFLNFQIKKARFFVKTEGLYSLFSGKGKLLEKDYFMVYRYPLNVFRVKFGVSWAFYD
ncbi:hypothetical protein FACS189430_10200 [Bacteroidia bacterium]|nr:hypothetical protein FACS189430_10200 [Bacteroidia bacterium]